MDSMVHTPMPIVKASPVSFINNQKSFLNIDDN